MARVYSHVIFFLWDIEEFRSSQNTNIGIGEAQMTARWTDDFRMKREPVLLNNRHVVVSYYGKGALGNFLTFYISHSNLSSEQQDFSSGYKRGQGGG